VSTPLPGRQLGPHHRRRPDRRRDRRRPVQR